MADTRETTALINPLKLGNVGAGNYTEIQPGGTIRFYGTADIKSKAEIPIIALDYETADLTTGAQKYTMRMPFGMTLSEVRANLRTAPAGADLVVDINKNGASVLSTKLSIDKAVKSSGSVELTVGTDGEVSSVTVDGVTITSGAVVFNTDLTTTATDLAANITAFASTPNYTATAVGALVTITPDLAGDSTNGFAVTSTTTLTMTSADTALSGGVTETTSTTASSQAVISDPALGDDDEITIDIDQVGSSVAGTGLKLWLIGTRA